MEAMIRHQQTTLECNHSTALVISDRNDAKGLERATSLGVEAVCIPLPDVPDSGERRTQHEVLVLEALELWSDPAKGLKVIRLRTELAHGVRFANFSEGLKSRGLAKEQLKMLIMPACQI